MDHLLVSQLYWKLLNTQKAEATAEEGLRLAFESGDLKAWARLAFFLLRLFQETSQNDKFERLLSSLEEKQGEPEIRSGLNYLLGSLMANRREFEEADRLFEIAEVSALNPADEVRASYGRAMIKRLNGLWSEALEAFRALEERLAGLQEVDLEIYVQLGIARVAMERKESDLCERALVKARALAKAQGGLYGQMQVLITEAFLLMDQGKVSEARETWNLIERFVPETGRSLLGDRLEALKRNLHVVGERPAISVETDGIRSFLRIGRKEIEVTRLPQLVKLLTYLGEAPGRIFSKEEICTHIWGETYHPLRHDNKIYVTIRRLRNLLNETELPSVIVNRQDGYTYNPQILFRTGPISTQASSKRSKIAAAQMPSLSSEVQ